MKGYVVPFYAGGREGRCRIYFGRPTPGLHPLRFQAAWFAEEAGAHIPDRVLQGFAELLDLARQSGRPFEDFCIEALGASTRSQEDP